MARHTIGDKRGSVRGAPPDVYLPFGDYTEGDEHAFDEAITIFRHFVVAAVFWILLVVTILVLWGIGCTPDNWIDY